MNKAILFIVSIFIFTNLSAQTDEANLEKYWKFRNNFRKNFVKIGSGNGESVPLNAYRPDWSCADFTADTTDDDQSGSLKWGDAPSRIGFYLMMLSTEYRLLKDQDKDVTSVLNEIYYALETFNRLDRNAEPYLSQSTLPPTLDGYHIRDDVPEGFEDNFSQYNEGEFKCVDSDFFKRDNVYNIDGGPYNLSYKTYLDNNFPSKDQLSGILPGLAFVAKFVDNEFVKPTSSDVGFNIVDEAKSITDRYVMYLKNHEWWYRDPNNDLPVNNGGGDLVLESYPVGIIGNRITGLNYSSPLIQRALSDYAPVPPLFDAEIFIGEGTLEDIWKMQIPEFMVNNLIEWDCFESLVWQTNLFTICLVQDDVSDLVNDHNINTILSWVTLANLWDKNIVHSWVEASGFYNIDLVYALYNDETPYSNQNYYRQIMDGMQCDGPYANRLSGGSIDPAPGGWAAENRWIKPSYSITGSPEFNQHGTYSALDYMLYHNMYYLAFRDQLPPFEQKYSCECNDEIISPSVSILNSPVFVAKKFNDYYEKQIDDLYFLSHDVSIENAGEIILETDLTICNNSTTLIGDNGFIITSNTSNNRSGNLYIADGSTIEINNDGFLHVKSGTEVIFEKNSFFKLKALGRLLIEDNARVIIKPEANFIFDEDAIIELAGNNAILEIQGNVEIKDNATFTFTGDGFIRWNTLYQPNSNVTAGVNSKIKFQGSSRNDKVLEISNENGSGDCWMPDNLTLFQIQSGKVEFLSNGRLVIPCPFSLTASNFETPTTPFAVSRGVWVAGQTGMFLSGCRFYNTDIDGKLIYGGNPLKIQTCQFFDFSNVKIDGAGYQLTNCNFTNCPSAIEGSDLYQPSQYRNGTMTNCSAAIWNFTSNTAVSINKVNITSPGGGYAGIYQQQGLLNLKCSNLSGDDNGIWLDHSSLNSSIVGNTGGYSSISGRYSNILLDDANVVNLDNGYNKLLPTFTTTKIITGNLIQTCNGFPLNFQANNNKWLTNNSIDPNTTGTPQPNNTYPNAYNNPSASGCTDVKFVDINRGASASCAQFDLTSGGGLSVRSVFKNCTTCPMINGTFFNNVRMDEAVLLAMSKMELIDTIPEPTKNDFIAIRMFREIVTTPGLDLTDPDIAFLANYSYQMAKTTLQNCLNTGRLTKANNTPNLHACSNHYLDILNILQQPVTADNFKEQFHLSLDNALIYYWVGKYEEAILQLGQINNCYLTDEEYRLIKYWISSLELKLQFTSGQINLDEYHNLRESLPKIKPMNPTRIDPTANVNATASIGKGTVIGSGTSIGQNVIIGTNCIIGSNVSIDKDVIIGDNVVIADNTNIGKESTIGSETTIGSNTDIDKESQIGKNVVISNNVSIAKQIKIGDWSRIDADVTIDKETEIADGTYIGTNVSIEKETKIGSHAIIRRNSVIEKENKIGNDVIIDNDALIKKQSAIGKNVIVGEGLLIGDNAKLCDLSVVNSNVPNNGTIGSCSSPTIPSQPFNVIHDEIFAVTHAHIYGKMEDGFTVSPSSDHYFVGQTLTFDAKEYGSDVSWDFGNCSHSTGSSASYTFVNPGVYVITLKVNPPQGCVNGFSQAYIGSVSIHPKPTIKIKPEVPDCPSSDPVVYDFEFDPGNINVPGCMSKYGTYCTYSQLKSELCRLNISSDYGDGNSESNQYLFSQMFSGISKEHIYLNPDTYNYNFIGEYEAMQLTTENWININYSTEANGTVSLINSTNADFVLDEFVCSNSTQTIINTSSAPYELTYSWNLSDGQTSTDPNPIFDFTVPGEYTLTLIATDLTNTCSDTKEFTFNVADCQFHSMTIIDTNSTTKNSKENSLEVKLFPNPNSGDFSIEIIGLVDSENVTSNLSIYDSYGKLVYVQSNITNGTSKINLNALASGIYHWQLFDMNNKKTRTGNFVINK